jgi:hypothetical protein
VDEWSNGFTFTDAYKYLNQECLVANNMHALKCLMPENVLKYIKTPIFIMNSLMD